MGPRAERVRARGAGELAYRFWLSVPAVEADGSLAGRHAPLALLERRCLRGLNRNRTFSLGEL